MTDRADFDRVALLLGIVEKVATVAPGYMHISSEAMSELREINETLRKENERRKGQPVTPAPYGDEDSPAPIEGAESGNPALSRRPFASAPIFPADSGVQES